MMQEQKDDIFILYDGQCPFCQSYVQLVRLREQLNVHLQNARKQSPLRDEATAAGFNLDAGMVVKYRERLYHGADAMTLLCSMTTPVGWLNKTMRWLFRAERRAKILYPIFAFFRGLTVVLMGRGKIGNLK